MSSPQIPLPTLSRGHSCTPHTMHWPAQIQQLIIDQIPQQGFTVPVEHGNTSRRQTDEYSVVDKVDRVNRRRQSYRKQATIPIGNGRMHEQVAILAANPDRGIFARARKIFRIDNVRWPITRR